MASYILAGVLAGDVLLVACLTLLIVLVRRRPEPAPPTKPTRRRTVAHLPATTAVIPAVDDPTTQVITPVRITTAHTGLPAYRRGRA